MTTLKTNIMPAIVVDVVEKRPVGRPKSTVVKEPKEKRPVGRPRTAVPKEPKEPKPLGRPRIIGPQKEPKPKGRPRSDEETVLLRAKQHRENMLNRYYIKKDKLKAVDDEDSQPS